MARVLFVHNNFPAQFGFLASALRARGDDCAVVASETGRPVDDVPIRRWRLGRGTTAGIYGAAVRAEADLLRGSAAAAAAQELAAGGFQPDLIVGHPGWGETLMLRRVFPRARTVLYGEFYYRPEGADVGFDPEFGRPTPLESDRITAKNATGLLAYAEADRIVSPTAFQASLFPPVLRPLIRVIHEGVDTDMIAPGPTPRMRLGEGVVLDAATPVVTYVSRRFEPLRGFHTVMRALPELLGRVPDAHVLLVGADDSRVYGAAAGSGTTWKGRMLAELAGRLDLSRIHFTGTLPPHHMHALMRLGRAHVYLTYPFALSWSMLEAMSLGALVVGSRTAPVEEAIVDGANGYLVDMFDPAALAERLAEACSRPREAYGAQRGAARDTIVTRYDRARVCLPAWLALIDEVLAMGPVGASA